MAAWVAELEVLETTELLCCEILVDVIVTPGQPGGKFEVPPLAYRLN